MAELALLVALLVASTITQSSSPPWGHFAVIAAFGAVALPHIRTDERSTWKRRLFAQLLTVIFGWILLVWWADRGIAALIPLLAWPIITLLLRIVIARGKETREKMWPRLRRVIEIIVEQGAVAAEAVVTGGSVWLFGVFGGNSPDTFLVAVGVTWVWAGVAATLERLPDGFQRKWHHWTLRLFLLAVCTALSAAVLSIPFRCCLAFYVGIASSHWALRRWRGRNRLNLPVDGWSFAIVLVGALTLLRGLATQTVHGTGDALWYGTMLADMVEQTRQGVFPVFVGQSEYQFNGAIYPLRVAPAFHFLGALLDTVTLRTLGVFALQNLLLTLLGVVAALATFFTCRNLTRGRSWISALLALIFLGCPGSLGIVYNTDLYMSWTTLPGLVLAFWATARSFDRPSKTVLVALGSATGWLWWGHAPIALWCTIFLGLSQLARLIAQREWSAHALVSTAYGAAAFCLVAAYPLGSVVLYPPEPGLKATTFQVAWASTIHHFVREAFPGVLQPLSENGRKLSDFQLGYSLWLIWLWLVASLRRKSGVFVWMASAWVTLLLLLLVPVPTLNLALWSTVPDFVRDITSNWPMNRLYVIAAVTLVTVVAWLIGRDSPDLIGFSERTRRKICMLLLAIACSWSILEAGKFVHGSLDGRRPAASARDLLLSENIQITRFAYLVYPRLPSHFTHGVMAPQAEFRLFDESFSQVLVDRFVHPPLGAPEQTLLIQAVQRPTAPAVEPILQLVPNERYLAVFTFGSDYPSGVLQLAGSHQLREYALPVYGEPRSFGIGASRSNALVLWTSQSSREQLAVRFFPDSPSTARNAVAQLAVYRLTTDQWLAQITQWHPFTVHTAPRNAGWLETPRMYLSGYRARVNGKLAPVQKSPDGLVAVAVPAGQSEVVLAWEAPVGLRMLFWISSLSFMAVGIAAMLIFVRRTAVLLHAKSLNRSTLI